ncbi:tetratricopeptide repeat protein [Actinospica robiniae]|uniref:tetratricopeptide repeat protein n=1 Tax=Actinospica robiniae TaxID=304901 RepID=UPI0004179CB4|nr:tetratricopeptide repeat protein [Actinospica robiniae]
MTARLARPPAPASIDADERGGEAACNPSLRVPDWASGIELPGVIPLIAPARRVLAVLAAFDGVDAPAAVIAAHADLPTSEALRHLRHLARHHLAQTSETDPGSFRAAPGPSPLRPAILTCDGYTRATTWHLACTFEAAQVLGVADLPGREQIAPDPQRPTLSFTDRSHALDWFVGERARLLREIGAARESGGHAQAWRLALLTLNISTLTGAWDGWQQAYEHGIAAAYRDTHRGARAMLEEYGGHLDLAGGNTAAARTRYQRSLEIRSADGDAQAVIRSLHGLGLTWLHADSLPEAEILFDQAVDLAREAGDQEREAVARIHLGAIHARTGRAGLARDELSAALAAPFAAGHDLYRVHGTVALAAAHRSCDDLASAEQTALEAVHAAAQIGIPLLLAEPLVEHARIQAARGHLRVALALLHEAQAIYAEHDQKYYAMGVGREIDRLTCLREPEACREEHE